MKLKPLEDRIVIKRVATQERSPGGIIIPDAAKEKSIEAEVVAVGTGRVFDNGTVAKPSVKRGDRVLFSKWSGTEVQIDGVEHLIVKECDILGIVE